MRDKISSGKSRSRKGPAICFLFLQRVTDFPGERQEHPKSDTGWSLRNAKLVDSFFYLSRSVEVKKGTGSRRRFIHKFWDSFFLPRVREERSHCSWPILLAGITPVRCGEKPFCGA